MPDTGSPYNIPFLDGTELVRAYPAFSEDLADAIVDGLDLSGTDASDLTTGTLNAARLPSGTIISVKEALKTNTQSSSVTATANVEVAGLSITHSLANASNKLIISAYFGVVGTTAGRGDVGIAVADGSTLLALGDAAGNRTRVAAGGSLLVEGNTVTEKLAITFVYFPGSTASKTYTVRAINIWGGTNTIVINRSIRDQNINFDSRGSSGLVIQEVKV